MADPLTNYMRPGFPKESLDDSSYRSVIEYVCPFDEVAGRISTGQTWGDHPGVVKSAELEPIHGTSPLLAILAVIVERKFDTDEDGSPTGELAETNYEIDWVDVQRSLYEHPSFAEGGEYALTSEDIENIEAWKLNPYPDYKKDYVYSKTGYDSPLTADSPELSDNAKMCAVGIQKGIDYWVDKAPVARKSETYVNGPPPQAEAGKKDTPAGFPNLPSGYEWIRSADRGLMRGSQFKWSRDIEWMGAKKVLIDSEKIYWSAP